MSLRLFIVYKTEDGVPGMSNDFYCIASEEVDNLVGRVLTQLEAVFPQGSQLDALKSILKQEIWKLTSDGLPPQAFRITKKWNMDVNDYDMEVEDPWGSAQGSSTAGLAPSITNIKSK